MAIAIGVTAVLPRSVRAGDEIFASMGTGELSGIYYPVGKAICEIVNQDLRTHGVRCSPEPTPGSVYNIDALQSGELEFAIVQSDVQYDAYTGERPWSGRAFRGMRSVVSLYPELVTIMVRANSPIHNLSDLAGRRVNVGIQGSGTRATWDEIEAAVGWRDGKRVHPVGLRGDATASALCSGELDASLMIVGQPSPLVTAQQAACAVNFVAISGPAIDKLVHDHPYYQNGTIGSAAHGIAAEVPTFGVRATLVTSASVDARVVAVCAKELLTHLAELRALHPALAGLTAGEMIKDGLTAPPHPGAAQVYKELELR
jgi:TRAP transporter TAXI family solute receptor